MLLLLLLFCASSTSSSCLQLIKHLQFDFTSRLIIDYHTVQQILLFCALCGIFMLFDDFTRCRICCCCFYFCCYLICAFKFIKFDCASFVCFLFYFLLFFFIIIYAFYNITKESIFHRVKLLLFSTQTQKRDGDRVGGGRHL